MAFIDTGISYENPVFRYSDGSSRILAIWDQTDQSGQSPEGFLYGTEYVREQIDRALELEDPHSLVPEKDEIGHGTAVASVAAGSRLEEGSLFTGAAPDCEIVAVKLRPAKQYLRDYYRIADKEPAYSTDDILLAVKYVQQFVIPLYRPIVICLGLGTSFGSHSGVSLFSEYLQRIARSVSQAVVIGGGNEGNTAGHFRGRLTETSSRWSFGSEKASQDLRRSYGEASRQCSGLRFDHPAGSSCRRWNLVWAAQWNTRLSMKRRGYRLQILQTNAIPEIS